MGRVVMVLFIALLISTVSCSCGSKSQSIEAQLTEEDYTWIAEANKTDYFEFYDNGTGTYTGEPFEWCMDGNSVLCIIGSQWDGAYSVHIEKPYKNVSLKWLILENENGKWAFDGGISRLKSVDW